MAPHPLAVLRTSAGLSHPAYARLIAETHARLGFGTMAARREKISRWESGRTVPEISTQLAIAEVHGVSAQDVRRLGWPHWLHLATDDAALLEQPWTRRGAITAARSTSQPSRAGARSYLAVTGTVLDAQVKKALTALADPQRPHAQEGRRVTPRLLAGIEARLRALEAQGAGASVTPTALRHAAGAEHRLITGLLHNGGYAHPTGVRLLLLATRTAVLCGYLGGCTGDEGGAERYNLAALRTASAAGSRPYTAVALSHLVIRHLISGDARDALSLLTAVRSLVPRPFPRCDASLLMHEAVALARVGEETPSMRAMDRAAALVTAAPDEGAPVDTVAVRIDEDHLTFGYGNAWQCLGQHKRALAHFAPLFAPASAQPPPHTARRILHAVDAHLAVGDVDAAAECAHHAVDILGSLPPGLADQYRRRFAPHRTASCVGDLLRRLPGNPSQCPGA